MNSFKFPITDSNRSDAILLLVACLKDYPSNSSDGIRVKDAAFDILGKYQEETNIDGKLTQILEEYC